MDGGVGLGDISGCSGDKIDWKGSQGGVKTPNPRAHRFTYIRDTAVHTKSMTSHLNYNYSIKVINDSKWLWSLLTCSSNDVQTWPSVPWQSAQQSASWRPWWKATSAPTTGHLSHGCDLNLQEEEKQNEPRPFRELFKIMEGGGSSSLTAVYHQGVKGSLGPGSFTACGC